jgi:hypothetical protein
MAVIAYFEGHAQSNTKLPRQFANGIEDLPAKYADVELGEFIIMPNHIHGILAIQEGRGFLARFILTGFKTESVKTEGRGNPAPTTHIGSNNCLS